MCHFLQPRAFRKSIFSTFLLLLFYSSFPPIHAQSGTIKGSVFDAKTKEPLPGASVFLSGIGTTTVADSKGNFSIRNVAAGSYTLSGSFLGYKPFTTEEVTLRIGDTTYLQIALHPNQTDLVEITIVARTNRERENAMLMEQRKSLVGTQMVGAEELSRKGAADAEAAVAKVSGISKQEGVQNVFVRGLGDRYNATLLNGMRIPSENPEYKNVALTFFGADMIQNIGVNKVFSAENGGDVGGAMINITSKELLNNRVFTLELSQGVNTNAQGKAFFRPAGSNYLGFADKRMPAPGRADFKNSLDPSAVRLPFNHGFKISGGRRFNVGENPLSFLVIATHATGHSYTKETVRSITTSGTPYQDQTGERYSGQTNQVVLGNANYKIGNTHSFGYNIMMLHVSEEYVGEYLGKHSEKHQDGDMDMGYLRRQQINDNLLLIHHLSAQSQLKEKLNLTVDFSYHSIKGLEPDRRENYLSKRSDGSYGLTGSNRQKRFFSELSEQGYQGKIALNYKLKDALSDDLSGISFGYNPLITKNQFEASEYNFSAIPGSFSPNNIILDELYNTSNYDKGMFTLEKGKTNSYSVTKNIQSVFAEGVYQFGSAFTAYAGLRLDDVHLKVNYDVAGNSNNSSSIDNIYFLPSFNFKYNLTKKQMLRLGLSKTYTLPQSKEISPYQYVNIGFASEGNPNLQPSDNYNIDLKWEYYPSGSELMSAGLFYKRILNPIARVDKGNSAGLLTYDNISESADIMGAEIEFRKKVFSHRSAGINNHKVSVGFNASFLHTSMVLNLLNTPQRRSSLEGAAPFIMNTDITYNYFDTKNNLTTTLVLNYFSNSVYTIGTLGFNDITEEGIPTIDFISSLKLNRHFTLKFKALNLLNPAFTLSRKAGAADEKIVLNQYKKGMNISLGISVEL